MVSLDAIHRARGDLEQAKLKVEFLGPNNAIEAQVAAWGEYLVLIQRVFHRLKAGSQGTASQAWVSGIRNLRSSDPLLSYLLHARNADEHGIARIERKQYSLPMMPGRGWGPPQIPYEAPKIVLLTVRDRGVEYCPPQEHLGAAIGSFTPLRIAELGLAFWTAKVDEAALRTQL